MGNVGQTVMRTTVEIKKVKVLNIKSTIEKSPKGLSPVTPLCSLVCFFKVGGITPAQGYNVDLKDKKKAAAYSLSRCPCLMTSLHPSYFSLSADTVKSTCSSKNCETSAWERKKNYFFKTILHLPS